MSYITPNTDLFVLHGVPLDVKNEYSIAFTSHAQQELFFFSKIKYRFTNQTYQRERRNWVRVEKNAEDLYDCNYMMFRNTAFGTKWFYAFITDVEYVSNNVSAISYVIDELQTWLLDYTYKPCYMKRTHTETDEFGENLTAEPFNLDDYVYASYNNFSLNTSELVVIIGISDTGTAQVDGKIYDGLYGGLTLYAFLNSDETGINTFLAQYKQNPDTVVCMYVCPKVMTDAITGIVYGQPIPQFLNGFNTTVTLTPLSLTSTLDGYRPKNMKMYSYPFNFMRIDNGSQETLTLRYELFADPTNLIQGVVDGTFQNPPELIFTPSRYKGNWVLSNSVDVLTMNGYPMLSWNNDTYRSWLSTHWLQIGKEIAQTTVQLAHGVWNFPIPNMKESPMETFSKQSEMVFSMVNTAFGYLDVVDAVYQESKRADSLRGNVASGNSLLAAGRKQYHEARVCIRHEQAEIIDNFLSMYGYAINKTMTPNRLNRPHWTYIQTASCVITGDLPAESKIYIEGLHNRGITWWRDPTEIGDYTLDNSPASNRVITVEANEVSEPITE